MLADFATLERIRLKTAKKRWKRLFTLLIVSPSVSRGTFIRLMADNSIISGKIGAKFELQDVMHVLKSYKFKMYIPVIHQFQ